MKKRMVKVIIFLLLIILLFPMKMKLKDGGTVVYQSVSGIYRISKVHRLAPEGAQKEYEVGTKVSVFGFEVYNDVQ